MADTKITALTAITSITPATFPLPIVDLLDTTMAGSGTTKKVTVNQILGCGGTATLASATITGDLTVDTSTLKVDSANNRVGIGTASPSYILDILGASPRLHIRDNGTGSSLLDIENGAGTFYVGRENSTGSGGLSGVPYAGILYLQGAYPIICGTNFTERYRIASDGVATWSNVGGVAGTAMTLNSTGLGVGVTPSAWQSGYKAIEMPGIGILGANGSADLYCNAYLNSSFQSIYRTTAAATNYAMGGGFYRWFIAPSGTAGNAITWTQAMTLDASGNLLVGTTSTSKVANTGIKFVSMTTAPELAIVGASSGADTTYYLYNTTAGAYRFYVGYNGTINATNTTISAISDARLKENVQDIDVGLDAILALKPRKFDWKAGKGKDIKGDRGFIAQEFEQVFPQLVDNWKDPAPEGEAPYKSVRQDLIPVLVKAIQELAAEVNALKNA
jgi:hypothetical protein